MLMTRLLTAGPRRGVFFARWALLGGLCAFCVVASGGILHAAPEPVPPTKEEPKKEEPKKAVPDDPLVPPLPDLVLPPGFDPAQAQRIQEQLKMMREAMRKQLAEMRQIDPDLFRDFPQRMWLGDFPQRAELPPGLAGIERRTRENRLGANVLSPTPALIDQLDLPKDQGVVIQELKEGSAASKAGLKPNDILLELDGKSVPSKLEDFAKMLDGIKADTAVDATVLRKGKKETVTGIKLPEVKAEEQPRLPALPVPNIQIQPAFPNLPPILPPGALAPGTQTSSVQMIRTQDGFTTRYRKNNEGIAINGKIKDGKAEAEEIVISGNGDTKKYKSVDDVPADMREQVRDLIKLTEKGTATVVVPEKKP
jgi:membrane-associated protease RseP (regulator of RpoE activity)